MVSIISSVKCRIDIAPLGHATAHVPHPLQSASFTMATRLPSGSSPISMALNSQISTHVEHPLHSLSFTTDTTGSSVIVSRDSRAPIFEATAEA